MASASVLAILVAHASRTRVAETLRSLGEQTHDEIAIVVASIGTIAVPDDLSPTVIQIPEPAGFADAVNHVLKTVRPEGFDYVLLLHDDVSLEPDAVERLVSTASSDAAIAAVGAKLVEWTNPQVLQEVGAAIDRFAIRRSALDAGEVDAGQRDETSDVLFCSDACLLVRRDALVEVAGLDAKAWPFYEDVDLCWRFRTRGARVVVEPSARARHAADLSRGRRLFESLSLREHAERGRLRFMLKHYAPLGLLVLLPQIGIVSLFRIIGAIFRRELWRVRVILGAWLRIIRDLPEIVSERRRAPKARVEDRELLALAARGAVGDVRGERAEWASGLLSSAGALAQRAAALARQPVTWLTVLAVLVVAALLRDVLFGGTFALGEVRSLPAFGDALADHFGHVRREGLDPFGPPAPGLILLGLVRSVLTRAPFAEKVVLLSPLWFAAVAGARVGRALVFGSFARRWLSVFAAVNPVTLSLLRDGAFGALVAWTASLWVVAQLLQPGDQGSGIQGRIRFFARWAFGWAVTVALHPPALLWLLVLGGLIVVVRREDGRRNERLRILVAGALGSFLLLLPWSIEWFTLRSPLVGRPGWLVQSVDGGLARASLGGGWPFVGWLVVAVFAAFFVGLDRTTFGLAVLSGVAVLAGVTEAFGRDTMLAAGGVCAFLIIAIAARHIVEEIPRYELGLRQAAVIAGVGVLAVLWAGGVATTVPSGARDRDVPVIAGVHGAETGRVLWLAETTGGVRSWSTLSFGERLGNFPPPSGPEERMVTKAIEAARAGRTHRLGGALALADISHIVALDAEARRGLGSQADLAPQEEQGTSTIYRNDGWRGPVMQLAAAPTAPLSPKGLADVVRDPRKLDVRGWPYGPIRIQAPQTAPPKGAVVYVAGGHRGGLRIEGGQGRIAAAGAYVPASDVSGTTTVGLPGRWWRWFLPLQALFVVALLGAWLVAAYIGDPVTPTPELPPDLAPMSARPLVAALAPVLVVAGIALGWAGVSWGVGTPFLSSAWYCPPIGKDYQQTLAIVNPNAGRVDYLVRTGLSGKPVKVGRISGKSRTTLSIDPVRGAVIEAYGRRLVVATEVNRLGDRDTSLCASDTRSVNIFPEGGRAATRAVPRLYERYVLYNPFQDLARASVRFVSPEEPISPPALQDVQILPGRAVVIDPEEQFEPMLDLSTTVNVWQGRAIVARRLRTIEQVSWSLPVDETTGGIVPRVNTADGVTNLIAVNLSDDPAQVRVFGAGRTGSLPEKQFDVPGGERRDFEIADLASSVRDVVVEVESNVPVAIESLVATDDREAVSLFPPLAPQRRWAVPIGEDRELYLVNPSSSRVRVQIERLGPGPRIRTVTIAANQVRRVRLVGTKRFGLLIESNGRGVTPVVVGARGSTPGVPLP
jgi:GT2 family glycosyltransferase